VHQVLQVAASASSRGRAAAARPRRWCSLSTVYQHLPPALRGGALPPLEPAQHQPQHPLAPEQQVVGHTGAGVLWEVDVSHIGAEDCSAVVDSLEVGLLQRCRGDGAGELGREVVLSLRAVLAGVPALRKYMLSKTGHGHE